MSDFPEDDAAYIRGLARLLEETGLGEISVRRAHPDGGRIAVRVARAGAGAAAPPAAPPAPAPAPAGAAASPGDSAPAGAVTAPMVGTAYLAPEPGADPFIRVGTAVEEGQTLLILEAMKTMNPIPAPRGGVVRGILVEDGEPVEYEAPLVLLD